MVFYAPAKVNLYLELLARLSSGYHSLDTVMATVSWYDTLVFEPPRSAPDALELVVVDHGSPRSAADAIPTDETNLVLKALLALRQQSQETGVVDARALGARVTLTKRIASQAGLGGGSSDAATALMGANEFWRLGLNREALQPIAANLGSDVAFFLTGGLARCRSRGEVVEQFGMGRRLAERAEFAGRLHDAAAKVVAPDSVHDHPGGQWCSFLHNRLGQFQATTSLHEMPRLTIGGRQ